MEHVIAIGSIIISAMSIAILILNHRINDMKSKVVYKDEFYQFEKRFEYLCIKVDKLCEKVDKILMQFEWDGTERRKK